MGRPAYQPDEVSRRQVEAMAGYGVPETEIAGLLGIDPKTLRKYYRHELDHGHTKANVKVAENLYRKATGEGREAVTAAIFWLKARAGWREITAHEIDSRSQVKFDAIEYVIVEPDGTRHPQPPRLIGGDRE